MSATSYGGGDYARQAQNPDPPKPVGAPFLLGRKQVQNADGIIPIDYSDQYVGFTGTGTKQVVLPQARLLPGRVVTFKDESGNMTTVGNRASISCASGDSIETAAGVYGTTYTMSANGLSRSFISDGISRWFIVYS